MLAILDTYPGPDPAGPMEGTHPMHRLPGTRVARVGIAKAIATACAVSAVVATAFVAATAVQKSEAEEQLEFGAKVARMGSWREAAFRFERAVSADAANARAWNNLAVARESLGEMEAAREAYERALVLVPDDRRIRANYDRFLNNYRTRRNPVARPAATPQEDPPAPEADPAAPGTPEKG